MSEHTLTEDDLMRRRLAYCVAQWPECWSGGYDPRCCRFPKSCSPHGYIEAVRVGNLTEDDLEPVATLPPGSPGTGAAMSDVPERWVTLGADALLARRGGAPIVDGSTAPVMGAIFDAEAVLAPVLADMYAKVEALIAYAIERRDAHDREDPEDRQWWSLWNSKIVGYQEMLQLLEAGEIE